MGRKGGKASVERALRLCRADGGMVSDTEQDQMRAASDPHRYERFVEPVAKGVQWLKDMVKAPFDMARDAREAGGYSNLDPTEVGRAGLNTGLGALAPAAGLATGALPKGSGFVLSSGGAPSEPKGIRAYHGSPHDFDRFDLSKIGTGEGAQAYGHGLYFAESEGVAKSYRDNLSKAKSTYTMPDGTLIRRSDVYDSLSSAADSRAVGAAERLGDWDAAKAELLKDGDVEGAAAVDALRQHVSPKGFNNVTGRMYEVRINADPNDFLDWDKPLSQQSEGVAKRMKPVDIRHGPFNERDTIRTVMDTLDSRAGKYGKRMSDELREAGIPGIKYLDQGSRAAGDGSRNYVLFRDDIIQIVRKYGMAAAVSMYGADAVSEAMGKGDGQ